MPTCSQHDFYLMQLVGQGYYFCMCGQLLAFIKAAEECAPC